MKETKKKQESKTATEDQPGPRHVHSTARAASASLRCYKRPACEVCADRTPCGRRLCDSKRTDDGDGSSDRKSSSRTNASSLSVGERFAIHTTTTTPYSSSRCLHPSPLPPRVCLCRTLAQVRRSLGGVRQTAVRGAAVAGQIVRATEGHGHAWPTCTPDRRRRGKQSRRHDTNENPRAVSISSVSTRQQGAAAQQNGASID